MGAFFMRDDVHELMRMGPLPGEAVIQEQQLATYERLLRRLSPPLTDEEARALVRLFGPDTCYGLAWTLVHLIETAPGWPFEECFETEENEWVQRLRERVDRGRKG
jgi:hypothetical protein